MMSNHSAKVTPVTGSTSAQCCSTHYAPGQLQAQGKMMLSYQITLIISNSDNCFRLEDDVETILNLLSRLPIMSLGWLGSGQA